MRDCNLARDMTSTPFFIVGMPRSGTTLLQSALSSHSALIIPPEEDLVLACYGRFGAEGYQLSNLDIDRYLDYLFDIEQTIRYWRIDRDRLSQRLLKLPDRRYRSVIEATYLEFMSRFPEKSRWGGKVPFYVRHLDKIDTVFPDARFLHMIRDPRAVHASMCARRRRGDRYFSLSPWRNGWQWRCWVGAGQHWSDHHPGRCLEVHYEQLVESPQQTLTTVCDFLEIPFQRQMLSHYEHTTASSLIRTDNIDRYLKRDFSNASVDAWRDCCSSRELRIVERLAGQTMQQLGYSACTSSPARPRESTIALYQWTRQAHQSIYTAVRKPLARSRHWLASRLDAFSRSSIRSRTKLAASR